MSMTDLENKVAILRELRRMADELAAEIAATEDDLKAYMGDSEELRAGEYKVTWKAVKSTRIDTAALRKACPDVAQAFSRETTTRRFCVA